MEPKRKSLDPELLAKIKEIEIYTRRLLAGGFMGGGRSSVKGAGLEFEQMRDYVAGDDVRYIDWNASSRLDRLVVREYIEEKNKTILLVVDVSSSMFFGSPKGHTKQENVQQLASVLALVSSYAQDKVGLVMFSDRVECFVPPRQGTHHVRAIMEHLFSHVPAHSGTSMRAALDFVARLKMRNALVFLISDFLDESPAQQLCMVANKHDLITILCKDAYEYALPAVGLLPVMDTESGEHAVLDLRKRGARAIADFLQESVQVRTGQLKRAGAHVISVTSDRPFIHDIVKFFRRRIEY